MSNIGIKLSALLVVGLLGLFSYSSWTLASDCTRKAHELLAAADPLDRQPPASVIAAFRSVLKIEDVTDMLSTVLLDRYKCRRADGLVSADWLIDHFVVRAAIRHTFDDKSILALLTSTADMGRGTIGFNRGARLSYGKDVSALDRPSLDCLIYKSLGRMPPSNWECVTNGFRLPPVVFY